jgi:hypothetical protein
MVVSNFVDLYSLQFWHCNFFIKEWQHICWPWTWLHHYHYLQLGHGIILIFALSVVIHQFVNICEMGACDINTYSLGLLCWVTWFTTTYCAFLRRAKEKTGRVCKAKQPTIFAMRHASHLMVHQPSLIYNVP